jgi:hypothetical protein
MCFVRISEHWVLRHSSLSTPPCSVGVWMDFESTECCCGPNDVFFRHSVKNRQTSIWRYPVSWPRYEWDTSLDWYRTPFCLVLCCQVGDGR